jgi:hypothetical protein
MANPFFLGAAHMMYCYFIRWRAGRQLSSAQHRSDQELALGHNQSSKRLILLEKSILALPAYCLSRWEERVYSKKTPTGGNDAGRSYQQATAESPAVSVNSIT